MRRLIALALAVTLVSTARAQDAAVTPQGSSRPDPGVKKVLGLAEVGRWNRIAGAALSPDGKWMTYAHTSNDGDPTLFVKFLDGDKLYTINVGSGGQFSDDSRFIGYFVSPPERTGRGAGGRGGRGGGPAPAQGTTPGRRFELLDLSTGEKFSVPDGAAFKFSKGSKWLVVKTNKANATAKHNGTDLVLRDLTTGATQNIGNVNAYDFNDPGTHLAYTVDAADRVGNGVYLIDLATSTSKALNTATADYDQLTWSDKANSLLALRGDKPKDKKLRANSLLAWIDVGSPKVRTIEYDPSKDGSFPKNMVLSEFTPARFTRDGSRIVFGIKEQEDSLPPSAEPQANVDVWHWKDTEVQSVQMIRLNQERRATYTATLNLATSKFMRLADSTLTNVQLTANPKWGIGRVDTTYRGEVAWGGSRADYYRVNTETGERSPIDRSLSRTMGTSPDGKWFLYLKDKQVFAYNLETSKSTPVAPGMNFVDSTDDHPYERPIYGVAGWTKDGRSVLLNHRFDIWNIPLDGGKPTSLTAGVGDAQQIVFRIVRLDRAGGGGRGGRGGGRGGFGAADEEDAGIDLTKPVLLSAYGEWTKKSGYYTLPPNGKPTPLVYEDAQIAAPQKAEKADRVIFTRQTFTQFPDYWLSNSAFASPKRVTDANPFITEYAWGPKRVLVDYTNSKGQKLQGTLTLPANYEPGKKYPMIVYFYEIMSNTHHTFSMPVYDDRPHPSEYASDGYLFFSPDVVYDIGRPGSSAVDCVTSAVKKVIELGYADPKRIGLQGHSWGGYQTSFMVTQTDMFAAVVTGAPPTNLISFYDETYPGTGTLQQGITEVGQVRMGTNPWDSHDLYEDQSPIFHVKKIKTPFMILHGTADNAVDWHQGLEFYGAARRWGKNVILLSYPGEPHHLARKENQKDFQTRMKQYFDHYLKGKPAPKWMTDGVPQVRKGGPIQ